MLPPGAATKARVFAALEDGVCSVFYMYGHGGVWPWNGGSRTVFRLDEPVPSHEVLALGLDDSDRVKFVWIDACQTGRMGDMADAFGMYSSDNFMYMDQTYVGWDGPSYEDPAYTAFNSVFWQRFSAGYTAYQSLWWAGWTVSWDIYDNTRSYGYPMTTWMPGY